MFGVSINLYKMYHLHDLLKYMWPIGRSSCDQTLNSKAFGKVPIVRKLEELISVLMTEKKKKKDNQYKLNKAIAIALGKPCHPLCPLTLLPYIGYPILDALKEKYRETGGKFLEVPQLGETLGLRVISRWLNLKHRKMTEQQEQVSYIQ